MNPHATIIRQIYGPKITPNLRVLFAAVIPAVHFFNYRHFINKPFQKIPIRIRNKISLY
jgi:hypothetical protein